MKTFRLAVVAIFACITAVLSCAQGVSSTPGVGGGSGGGGNGNATTVNGAAVPASAALTSTNASRQIVAAAAATSPIAVSATGAISCTTCATTTSGGALTLDQVGNPAANWSPSFGTNTATLTFGNITAGASMTLLPAHIPTPSRSARLTTVIRSHARKAPRRNKPRDSIQSGSGTTVNLRPEPLVFRRAEHNRMHSGVDQRALLKKGNCNARFSY